MDGNTRREGNSEVLVFLQEEGDGICLCCWLSFLLCRPQATSCGLLNLHRDVVSQQLPYLRAYIYGSLQINPWPLDATLLSELWFDYLLMLNTSNWMIISGSTQGLQCEVWWNCLTDHNVHLSSELMPSLGKPQEVSFPVCLSPGLTWVIKSLFYSLGFLPSWWTCWGQSLAFSCLSLSLSSVRRQFIIITFFSAVLFLAAPLLWLFGLSEVPLPPNFPSILDVFLLKLYRDCIYLGGWLNGGTCVGFEVRLWRITQMAPILHPFAVWLGNSQEQHARDSLMLSERWRGNWSRVTLNQAQPGSYGRQLTYRLLTINKYRFNVLIFVGGLLAAFLWWHID